jgi:CubicO group peptidase (beta-lactamase class C family)
MKKTIFALVLLLALGAPALAQTNPALESRVDAIFNKYGPATPGCALGIVREGKLEYQKGFGMASLELGVPMTPRTVFDIGSTSKQFTATSIVLLAQQGKLTLDDDIRKFIPELPDYGHTITLRHMLHHTSGLRDYIGLLSVAGAQQEAVTTDADALAVLVKQRGLNYNPGEDYLYSNSNFFLLSLVVRRASGKALKEFAQENIFKPLGMTHTEILDDHTKVIPGKAASYAPRRGGAGYFSVTSNWEQTGDGAVQTTIEDLAKWDDNFYRPNVGGEGLLRELQTVGMLNDGAKIMYALGLRVDTFRGLRRVSHGGSWAGFRTELMRFPDQHFTAIVQCNVADSNPSDLAQQVAEVYLEKQLAAKPAPVMEKATIAADQVAGTYFSSQSLTIRRLVSREGKLLIGNQELTPAGGSLYTTESGSKWRFEGSKLTIVPAEGRPDTFERVMEANTTAAELSRYAGSYWSEELGVNWRITVHDGRLELHRPDNALNLRDDTTELRPVKTGVLAIGGMVLRFDETGGFELGLGRMRGMKFVCRSAAPETGK